jgi:hypothetical protein
MGRGVIKRRAMFADIRQHDMPVEGGAAKTFEIAYRKMDGTLSRKRRVSKSFRRVPGQSGFKINISTNHLLLLHDHDKNEDFNIHIDLIVEYNNMVVDHRV